MISQITEDQALNIIPSNLFNYYQGKTYISPVWFCPAGGDGYMNPPMVAYCQEEVDDYSAMFPDYEIRTEKPEIQREGVRFQKFDSASGKFIDEFDNAKKEFYKSKSIEKINRQTNVFFEAKQENKLINEALKSFNSDGVLPQSYIDFLDDRDTFLANRDSIKAYLDTAPIEDLQTISNQGVDFVLP